MLQLLPKLLISFALAGLAWPYPAVAVAAGGVGFYPTELQADARPWLVLNVAPGGSVTRNLTLQNGTGAPVRVKLYAVDGGPLADGGFGMLSAHSPRTDAGGWFTLSADAATVPARGTFTFDATFTVPPRAVVGPHYAGVVAELADPTQQERQGVAVNIVSRLGIRVYQTVPGDAQPALRISKYWAKDNAPSAVMGVSATNTGNTLVRPLGTLKVTNALGQVIQDHPLPINKVLKPGQVVETAVTWPLTPKFINYYTASVRLWDPASHVLATQQTGFWMVNWPATLAAALGVAIGIVSAVVAWGRRAKNRSRKAS